MCQPTQKNSNHCFEILGFDMLIDSKSKVWLLEVNQAPSFATDSELDLFVKKSLIMDTFNLLGLSVEERKKKVQ